MGIGGKELGELPTLERGHNRRQARPFRILWIWYEEEVSGAVAVILRTVGETTKSNCHVCCEKALCFR